MNECDRHTIYLCIPVERDSCKSHVRVQSRVSAVAVRWLIGVERQTDRRGPRILINLAQGIVLPLPDTLQMCRLDSLDLERDLPPSVAALPLLDSQSNYYSTAHQASIQVSNRLSVLFK